ncbi:MAG: ATP-binding protein [Anaerolineaceae bacterium]|nr:ATP-binding protein [Anaerolineaceae bacterium]
MKKISLNNREIEVDAVIASLARVGEFVESYLSEIGCPMKAIMQINIAVDEIFTNIASYAYDKRTGKAAIKIGYDKEASEFWITFTDSGKPYDPMAKEDPDITLSAAEREIGGLGIFMAKKLMDEITYEYRDEKNILTMKKRLS